jgi:hypothetical protein
MTENSRRRHKGCTFLGKILFSIDVSIGVFPQVKIIGKKFGKMIPRIYFPHMSEYNINISSCSSILGGILREFTKN